MRIINTQKKTCNRVFTNQARLLYFMTPLRITFSRLISFWKQRLISWQRTEPSPLLGKAQLGFWDCCCCWEFWWCWVWFCFQYATSIFTELANKWIGLLNSAGPEDVFTHKHALKINLEPQSRSHQLVSPYKQNCETTTLLKMQKTLRWLVVDTSQTATSDAGLSPPISQWSMAVFI